MDKVRLLLKRFKVTVMVIPSADQHIKQKNINLAAVFLLLIILIIINLLLMFTSITSKFKATVLTSENRELISEMTYQQDNINALKSLSDSRLEEINALKSTLSSSAGYLDERLAEIEAADERIETLVAMFNTETNSNLATPVSRSYNRTTGLQTQDNDLMTNNTDNEAIMTEIDTMLQNEEISDIIQSKTEAYNTLITTLEKQILYLDCRPDLVPTSGTFTSPFGYRVDPVYGVTAKHNGIDIANDTGTPIYAAGTGIVSFAGYNGSFGNLVIIDHGYGYKSVYAHCEELLITEGEKIEKGTLIAKMGSTGKSTGTHLHFEIRYNDNPINPKTILNLDQ